MSLANDIINLDACLLKRLFAFISNQTKLALVKIVAVIGLWFYLAQRI